MVQRQPEQERMNCDNQETQARRRDQRDPLVKPPIGYDEAIAGREPDGGESLLSGAPREGEAEQVHKASQEQRFPQVKEPAANDPTGDDAATNTGQRKR